VLEAGVVGEMYYLAMEYVDGRDLGLVLARCRERKIFLPSRSRSTSCAASSMRSRTRTRRGARPACTQHRALRRIAVEPVHLALGEIKLGDFGIAKVRSMGGDSGETLWGKLAYLARSSSTADR